MTLRANEQAVWNEGFDAGKSDMSLDWENALANLLPGDVECYPSQVAAYFQSVTKLLAEYHSIVTDFAAKEPVEVDETFGWPVVCLLCDVESERKWNTRVDVIHDRSCPWLRASQSEVKSS